MSVLQVPELLERVVAEDQLEDEQEHQREGDGEEDRGRVAPEALLVVAELVQGQGDAAHEAPFSLVVASRRR